LKAGEIDLELARSPVGRLEVDRYSTVPADPDFQNPRRLSCRRDICASPFATIQNERWSVNGLCLPVFGISLLSLRPFHRGKGIFPAETLPVIDMTGDRHELTPEPWVIHEPPE